MNIDCHFIGFNESGTIHLTIRHYKSFCRNVFYYDNFSTDDTRDIAEHEGAIVRMFGIAGQLNDEEYIKLKNNVWKGSDADWVIVCDADEILYSPILTRGLFNAKMNNVTILNTQGFNMFSNELPMFNWMEINTGIPDANYSKLVCFAPQFISEIGYIYGCHEAKPKGHVRYSDEIGVTANLLHYKHVGGAERIANRHAVYASRLAPINKKWGLGHQYIEPREKTIKYFNENLAKARPLW